MIRFPRHLFHRPPPSRARAVPEPEIERLRELLKLAACPDCDGSGAIQHPVTRTTTGCCGRPHPNGECCGNAVPVPVEDVELEPCRWCAERQTVIAKAEDRS